VASRALPRLPIPRIGVDAPAVPVQCTHAAPRQIMILALARSQPTSRGGRPRRPRHSWCGFTAATGCLPARRVSAPLTGSRTARRSAAVIMWQKDVPGIASPVSQATDHAAMVSSISDCVTRICQRRCKRREAGPSVILPVSDDDLDELLGVRGGRSQPRAQPVQPTAPRCRVRRAHQRPDEPPLQVTDRPG